MLEAYLIVDTDWSTKKLLKSGPNPASFCLFSSFSQHNGKYSTNITIKDVDGELGLKTGAAGW